MKLKGLTTAAGGKLGRFGLKLKKASPELLVITGIVAGIATVVAACRATTKLSVILDETKETVDQIHTTAENGGATQKDGEIIPYTREDERKDLAIVYFQTGWKLVKLYAPAAALGFLSATCVLGSVGILKRRNAGLAAAYAAVDKSFKEYRKRVTERFGEKVDKELKLGVKAQEIEETVTDEKGKEKKLKKVVDVAENPPDLSQYARVFDELNPNFQGSPEYNMIFLKAQQNTANDMLRARGHIYLNEVYDLLGFERTKAGQVVGWVYDKKNPKGDNYVDFGLYDIRRPMVREFINCYESAIWLDFNVDGDILSLMS